MQSEYTEKQQWALKQFDELAAKLGSQSKACAQIGISPAIISLLKKRTYAGNVEAQFDKIISYFDLKTEAAASPAAALPSADYVPTSLSQKVYEVIRNCHLQGGLAIACGDAGLGKTKAAVKYVKDHPSDAILVTVNPCITGIKSLLKLLCNRLSIPVSRTNDEMWLALSGRLRDGMVIIVDEAQHLPIKSLEVLRSLTDYFAEQGQTLGIAFVGNSETVNNFGGRKRAEFAQISNRTRQRKVYTTAAVTRDDIQMLFPALAGKELEIDFLLSVARSSQAIRGAVILFTNAMDNGNTSYSGLIGMAKHMELAI